MKYNILLHFNPFVSITLMKITSVTNIWNQSIYEMEHSWLQSLENGCYFAKPKGIIYFSKCILLWQTKQNKQINQMLKKF